MLVRLSSLVVVTAVILPAALPSLKAATLENIQGEVLVDRGGGFDVVSGPTELNPGDTVIVNPGSSAHIVYNTTCQVDVYPGNVVAVYQDAPCNGGSESAGGGSESAGGGGSGGFDTTTVLVGGAVVGLGAGAAVLLTSGGGDDKPASP